MQELKIMNQMSEGQLTTQKFHVMICLLQPNYGIKIKVTKQHLRPVKKVWQD